MPRPHQEDLVDEPPKDSRPAAQEATAVEIQHERGDKGAFYVERGGVRVAEMTYTSAGDGLIIIDHTEVDSSLRGQSVGRRLVDAVVAWARAEHKRIMPLCPFANSVFAKDPSLSDVLYQ